MRKYRVYFTNDNSERVHGVEFISSKDLTDEDVKKITLAAWRTTGSVCEDVTVKHIALTPLNDTFITDIY